MCERDFGHGCLNRFEHIEKYLRESEGNEAGAEALDDLKRLLPDYLDDEHLKQNRTFCGPSSGNRYTAAVE